MKKIMINPGNQLMKDSKAKITKILDSNKEIFGAHLPGYNHYFGKLEASFEFATKSRLKPNRARILDYCTKGNSL